MSDKRIDQAAQKVADETTRRKETSADLWGRYITNADKIPADKFEVASEVIIRACEILEKKQT